MSDAALSERRAAPETSNPSNAMKTTAALETSAPSKAMKAAAGKTV